MSFIVLLPGKALSISDCMAISLGGFPKSLLDSFHSFSLKLWLFGSPGWVLEFCCIFSQIFLYFFSLLREICSSFFQPFCFQSFNSPEFIFILWLFHFYGILFFLEGIITHLSEEPNGSFYLFVSFGVWFTSPCIVSLSHRLLFVSLVISVLVILDAFSMSQLIPFLLSLSTLLTCTSISFCLLLSVSPPYCELPEGRNKAVYSSLCCHSRHSINVCWIEFKSF